MRKAKQRYQDRNYQQAIDLNLEAIVIAQKSFAQTFIVDPNKAIAMVLVSHFSLIDGYEAQADFLTARQCFESAADFLLAVKADYPLNEAQKQSLIQGAQKLKHEWATFYRNHNQTLMGSPLIHAPSIADRIGSLFTTPMPLH